MRRALISLSDKSGAVDFARGLSELGFEILSTGGTLTVLRDAGLSVTPVDEVTGFPECLGGRVKTLHPLIHGGILGIRDDADHRKQMENLGIKSIDVVAVNLYPFKNTVLSGADFAEVVENVDIGGPSMVRSAAKNHRFVYVVTDAADYGRVLDCIRSGEGAEADALRFELAAKAFEHTANYDAMISGYFWGRLEAEGGAQPREARRTMTLTFEKAADMRYGENPHQSAAYYVEPFSNDGRYRQLHGKEMSYNNTADLTAAINGVLPLNSPACFAVKHAMPCGAAEGSTVLEAYRLAYECDPLSIFGGIVAFNARVDVAAAEKLSEIFLEVVAAPAFDDDALAVLTKKKNIRIIEYSGVLESPSCLQSGCDNKTVQNLKYGVFQKVRGGLLYQDFDEVLPLDGAKCVTKRQPTEKELKDLEFAMKICASAKSNAIVAAKDGASIGIGQGQVSRVFAAEIAVKNADTMRQRSISKNVRTGCAVQSEDAERVEGDFAVRSLEGDSAVRPLDGAVIASDAFFPFRDALEVCVDAGITAVVQPGGSVGDEDIIRLADEHGIAMLFTGRRHFRHCY